MYQLKNFRILWWKKFLNFVHDIFETKRFFNFSFLKAILWLDQYALTFQGTRI